LQAAIVLAALALAAQAPAPPQTFFKTTLTLDQMKSKQAV
jgi:hypothetical protein